MDFLQIWVGVPRVSEAMKDKVAIFTIQSWYWPYIVKKSYYELQETKKVNTAGSNVHFALGKMYI